MIMAIEAFDMSRLLTGDSAFGDDLLAIARLWAQIGGPLQKDPEALQQSMKGLDYFVARHRTKQRIIGAVSVMDCREGLAKIDSLAVAHTHQGRGYGYALVQTAVRHCFQNDFELITVLATPASQGVFGACGFEVDEVHRTGNATMYLDR
jgi:N-acetylglutamate synthase-like GNAT family acetyltransferase